MSAQAQSLLLLVSGLLFVLFLVAKLLRPERVPFATAQQARTRIADAKRRARDPSLDVAARAAALREAALIALRDLRRPSLAASYARRAERLDPHDPETLALLASSLRTATRFRALERLLWRRLADGPPNEPSTARALEELLSLYDGPLKQPEVARALRRLRGAATE